MIRRAAAIVGIGQTAYAKALPGTAWELAMEAVLAACADAGLDVTEVDGLCRFTAPFETVTEAMLVRGLGIPELSWFTQAAHGGEALGAVVMHAAAAVSAGLARTVVVYRALSQSRGGRFGRADSGGPGGGHGAVGVRAVAGRSVAGRAVAGRAAAGRAGPAGTRPTVTSRCPSRTTFPSRGRTG